MQCLVQAESEKPLLEPTNVSAERSGASCRSMHVLGANQGFLGGVVQASRQQHFAAVHAPQNTSEEDAGLIQQSMAAASETVARFWMVPCLLLIQLPVVESTVQWRTQQRLPPPIQSMEQEPTTPINRDTLEKLAMAARDTWRD